MQVSEPRAKDPEKQKVNGRFQVQPFPSPFILLDTLRTPGDMAGQGNKDTNDRHSNTPTRTRIHT